MLKMESYENQKIKSIFPIFFLFLLSLPAFAQKQNSHLLEVLTIPGYLSHEVVKQFEMNSKVKVRVEFAQSELEAQSRLRINPRAYDVVVLSESTLVNFGLSKRLLSQDQFQKTFSSEGKSLLRVVSSIEEGKAWVVLTGIPLGWGYIQRSGGNLQKELKALNFWNTENIVENNPSWRGRMCLPKSKLFQFLLQSLQDSGNKNMFLKDWLLSPSQVLAASKNISNNQIHSKCLFKNNLAEQLSQKTGPAIFWYSDFLRIKDYHEKYQFFIPKVSSLIERVSAAILIESTDVEKSVQFINFLVLQREKMASETGYLNLKNPNVSVNVWNILAEVLPLSLENENILKQTE
jgi:hypothetical protein